ncbi:MAG: NTP transferase domain-containing protein [Bacteroidota bacterium]
MIHGLVLAGGESRRMGSDKSLITIDGKPAYLHMAELLLKFCEAVYVSCREEQGLFSSHEHAESNITAVFDRAEFREKGPMTGILSYLSYVSVSQPLPSRDQPLGSVTQSLLRDTEDIRSLNAVNQSFIPDHQVIQSLNSVNQSFTLDNQVIRSVNSVNQPLASGQQPLGSVNQSSTLSDLQLANDGATHTVDSQRNSPFDANTDGLLIIGCDYRNMTEEALGKLLAVGQTQGRICSYQNHITGFIEPLAAYYPKPILMGLLEFAQTNSSLRQFVEANNPCILPTDNSNLEALRSFDF